MLIRYGFPKHLFRERSLEEWGGHTLSTGPWVVAHPRSWCQGWDRRGQFRVWRCPVIPAYLSPIWNCRARLAGRRAGSDVAVHPHDSPTNDLGWYHGRVELQPGGSSDPSARPNNGYGLVVAVVDGQDAGKRAELRCLHTTNGLRRVSSVPPAPVKVYIKRIVEIAKIRAKKSKESATCEKWGYRKWQIKTGKSKISGVKTNLMWSVSAKEKVYTKRIVKIAEITAKEAKEKCHVREVRLPEVTDKNGKTKDLGREN